MYSRPPSEGGVPGGDKGEIPFAVANSSLWMQQNPLVASPDGPGIHVVP